jgi:3-methyl-2-oxobutanoate hydroxymethyltransferase
MPSERKKVTLWDIQAKKKRGEPITMITAYDYPTALMVDRAGVDMVLVGDSLSMVVLGNETTLPMTMDAMIHHAQAVRRGAKYTLLIGDMPFMSYETSARDALLNAARFLKEAGMDAVKLEGGRDRADTIRALVSAGIAVQGHLGLTPQSISRLGGFRVQAKDAVGAQRLLDDALALEDAGCFSIVLEAVPDRVAELVTQRLKIPTIGIGAGPNCDGQVLVFHDFAGMFDRFTPKFSKKYIDLFALVNTALEQYLNEVKARTFPAPEHCYSIADEEFEKFKSQLDDSGNVNRSESVHPNPSEAESAKYGQG